MWNNFWLRLRVLFAAMAPWKGDITPVGRVYAKVIRKDGSQKDLGLVSTKVVTDAFVAYLVAGLQSNLTDVSLFSLHDTGTGVAAEDATDIALGTPYGGPRAAGTQGVGASPNIYQSVGTVAFAGAFAITEHGLFNNAVGGILCDRSVFLPINVLNGDSIQFTYELSLPSGS